MITPKNNPKARRKAQGSTLSRLVARFQAWREQRKWAALHLQFIQQMISEDRRWMGHDPTARALLDRYAAAVADNWYTRSHESISYFRTSIGLDPHRKPAKDSDVPTQAATTQNALATPLRLEPMTEGPYGTKEQTKEPPPWTF